MMQSHSIRTIFFPLQTRVKEYFRWAKEVVDNLRGTNQPLEDALDKIFKQQGILPNITVV